MTIQSSMSTATLRHNKHKSTLLDDRRLKIHPDILHFKTKSWKGYCRSQLFYYFQLSSYWK